MIVKNATREDLEKALELTNAVFQSNVTFKRLEKTGRRYLVTLRTKNSREPGSRIGHTGRRIPAACWHVFGIFFEKLFAIAPDAEVKTSFATVTAGTGNWQDRDIGSLYYSEACDCNR